MMAHLDNKERPLAVLDHAAQAHLRRLHAASLFEGTTLFILLAVAVPLKQFAGWDLGVSLMGPLHGLAFVAYSWMGILTIFEVGGRCTLATAGHRVIWRL